MNCAFIRNENFRKVKRENLIKHKTVSGVSARMGEKKGERNALI